MRSRYAAFAVGAIDYLVETLHPDHAERALPEDVLRSSLRAACRDHRYTGLTVLETSVDGDRGIVRFHARVFQRGKDISFSERSTFERVDGAWRYVEGETG
jgi:SEC-C motif-containing protein